jgi:CHAT domain-containing protein/Tfp pilus assembly protein PilF
MSNEIHEEIIRLYGEGKYNEALPLAKRALAIDKKALGSNHPDVATDLNDLAVLYFHKGDYAKAKPLYKRALAIDKKVFGPNHPAVATTLNNLAELGRAKGEYAKAEPLYHRSLAIREKAFGPNHPTVAIDLNNLAELYREKDDYAKAESLYQRALAIYKKAFGPNHPIVGQILYNLATLSDDRGDYLKAEPLYKRSLAIRKKAFGPNHPDVAQSLNNLAVLYHNKEDYVRAETLYQRALAIYKKAFGPNHPAVATTLNNLAELGRAKGEYAKAEPLYRRALAIREKALGPHHPDVAESLHNLAALYYDKRDYAKAEPLSQRALTIRKKAIGPNHPEVARSLMNLAGLYDAKGDLRHAVACCFRATDISERNIILNIATDSEQQKFSYLATFSNETNLTVSLHVHSMPNDLAARQLALTTILRRKGRVLDVTANSIGALRRRFNPRDGALLDQYINTCSQLGTHLYSGPGKINPAQYRAKIKRLEEQVEQLEAQISARSAEFCAQSQPITIEAVQATIPPDAALVEFVSYYPGKPENGDWETQSYVAYVLGNHGEPAWIDLGFAAEIDKAVNELRAVLHWDDKKKSLSDIEREVKPKARALDRLIMQPVRKLLGNKRTLLISPDGALNLVPFAALVDEQGKYLIESYSLTYLTTGRDLLRLQIRMENQQGVAVFADPNFEKVRTMAAGQIAKAKKADAQPVSLNSAAAMASGAPTRDFSWGYCSPLPSTANEARTVKKIFPDARVWTRQQATKTALKQLNAPAILHIATHGFFRTDQPGELIGSAFRIADPMLRSGLAMAGANLHFDSNYEGVLTAKEVSGLNLWGTKLVVLSACDTGVGEVKNGEGVYGLRRALVLAGSETQVMSLWPVKDKSTCELMIGYYKGLQAGEGRSEALAASPTAYAQKRQP